MENKQQKEIQQTLEQERQTGEIKRSNKKRQNSRATRNSQTSSAGLVPSGQTSEKAQRRSSETRKT